MPPPGRLVGTNRCARSGDSREASHGRVLRGEQLRRVRQPTIRIRHASVPLAPGDLDRLDLGVEAIGARGSPIGQSSVESTFSAMRRGDALRVRRDRGDLDVAVLGGDRLDPLASVGCDVLCGHDAAGRLDGAGDLGADRPAVVGVAAALADRSQ